MSSLSTHLILSLIAKESDKQAKAEIAKVIQSESPTKLTKLVRALKREDSARELEIATSFFVNQDLQNK